MILSYLDTIVTPTIFFWFCIGLAVIVWKVSYWHGCRQEKKRINPHGHFEEWCGQCERNVMICGKCGNTTCNSYQSCSGCKSAYEMDEILERKENE